MVEFLLILGAIVIYFTPLLVAAWLRHPKLAYIGGLNAALGVTVIGWAGALMWALRRSQGTARSHYGDIRIPRAVNAGLWSVAGLLLGVAVVATIGFDRLQGRSDPVMALFAGGASSPPQWQYSAANGVRTARLLSRNTLAEPSPFKGGPATLSIARGPEGYSVRLDVDGDMACGYAPAASTVQVSFDDGPPQTFACARAPDDPGKLLFDGAHSTAYLADPVAFLARLRNARHVRVASEFAGQSASQVMAFDLPPVDPIAQVSPASVEMAQAPVAAAPASAVTLASAAPPSKAAPIAIPASGQHHRTVRVAIRRHVPGYYLHPYRPLPRRAVRWAAY